MNSFKIVSFSSNITYLVNPAPGARNFSDFSVSAINIVDNLTEYEESYDYAWEGEEETMKVRELVRYMLFIGSILSLAFLSVALLFFYYFESIRCDRITVNINLMLALALKSSVLIVVADPGIFGDKYHYSSTDITCKIVIVLQFYTQIASINWMFVQGHYVNSRLTTNIFRSDFHINIYCCIGWGTPLAFVTIWLVTMEIYSNDTDLFCWGKYSKSPLIWIVVAPVLTALLINVLFLFNIIRILLFKNHLARQNSSECQQIRRAAKATVVLIPLLGLNNLIYFYNPGGSGEKYYMITNAALQPLQGILVAIFHCFICKDVYEALRRAYYRQSIRRSVTSRNTKNHVFSTAETREQVIPMQCNQLAAPSELFSCPMEIMSTFI